MSGQTNTTELKLDIDQARALMDQNNPLHLQLVGALVAASILIHQVEFAATSAEKRDAFLNLYRNLFDDIGSALERSIATVAAMDLLETFGSKEAEGGAL